MNFNITGKILIFFSLLPHLFSASVPYAGKVSIDGVNYHGEATFAFEIMDKEGKVHWRNGEAVQDGISIFVRNGRYSVELGGQGTKPLSEDLFLLEPELYLKVRIDLKDGKGYRHLAPDQRISSTTHALSAEVARRLLPGAVKMDMLASDVINTFDNNITLERLSKYLAPVILHESKDKKVYDNSEVTFSVDAEGKFLTYQWLKDGVKIPGEIRSSITFYDAQRLIDEGNYSVIIKNDFGEIQTSGKKLSFFPPIDTWQKTYGGPAQDSEYNYGSNIIQTNDGGYLFLTGSKSEAGGEKSQDSRGLGSSKREDFWLVKLDENGSKEWDKTYSPSAAGQDQPTGILDYGDGNYLLFGYSSLNMLDGVAIKVDESGNEIWNKSYGGEKFDQFWGGIMQDDKSAILVGSSDSNSTGEKKVEGARDLWLTRIDQNGSVIWDNTFVNDNAINIGISIIKNRDGIYIFSWNATLTYELLSMTLFKIDNNGNFIKKVTLDGELPHNTGSLPEVISTKDGGFIFLSDKENNGTIDIMIQKFKDNGSLVWKKSYGGLGNDYIGDIFEAYDGNYVVIASSDSNSSSSKTENTKGGLDYWITKIDDEGNQIWDKTYGGLADDRAFTGIESDDNGIMVLGGSLSAKGADKNEESRGDNDIWILKLNQNGEFSDQNSNVLDFNSSHSEGSLTGTYRYYLSNTLAPLEGTYGDPDRSSTIGDLFTNNPDAFGISFDKNDTIKEFFPNGIPWSESNGTINQGSTTYYDLSFYVKSHSFRYDGSEFVGGLNHQIFNLSEPNGIDGIPHSGDEGIYLPYTNGLAVEYRTDGNVRKGFAIVFPDRTPWVFVETQIFIDLEIKITKRVVSWGSSDN